MEERTIVFKEIYAFRKEKVGWSYYDVLAYAYQNDKDNWIRAMKNHDMNKLIASLIREMRKKEGVPYINSLDDSLAAVVKAEEEYNRRHSYYDAE